MADYLGAFVIGSSFFTFAPFYLAVSQMEGRNFSLEGYPVVASLYFGVMNMVSLWLAKRFGWNDWTRFAVISVISAALVSVFVTVQKAWNFDSTGRWLLQYLLLLLSHGFTFLVTIRLLHNALQI